MTKKYLLAVSGGPDSMFLLNQYRTKSVVVAHVNYHKRPTSDEDEAIVKNFCAANNIPCHTLSVTEKTSGNFQNWARKVRYDFFKKIYDDYSCDVLLTAHHKDDFIETAIMQMNSGRTPRQFGMAEKQELLGMQIYRPLLHRYWKLQIISMLAKKNIAYAVDITNEMPLYSRNVVRQELAKLTPSEKTSRYQWFLMSNRILTKKFRRVDRSLQKWKESNYSLATFKKINRDEKEIVYEYLTSVYQDVNLSGGKLQSIADFIKSRDGTSQFKISDKQTLIKKDGRLIAT